MMKEILLEDAETPLAILGINGIGLSGANDSITSGRDLPWLQDTAVSNTWITWDIVYRDVLILDRQNRPVGVFNLTEHDLSISANYDALRSLLDAAVASE